MMMNGQMQSVRQLAGDMFMGTNLARMPKSSEEDVEVPIIHVKDISDGMLLPVDRLDRLRVPRKSTEKRQSLQKHDILVSARGTLLKSAVVSDSHQGALASANFIVVRLRKDAELRPELLYAFLRQPAVREYIANRATGTAQPVLAIRELESLLVPIPPREVQDQLVRLLEVSEEQKRTALECAHLRDEETMDVLAKFMDPQNAIQN